MPEAVDLDRAPVPRWAQPGSSHDRFVRLLKLGLPALGLNLLVLLAIAPFGKKSEISFLLDKNKADRAQERMRVEDARYVGKDDKGQAFEIVADRAVQPSSTVPVVTIEGIRASLGLARGPVSIAALKGHYDLDNKNVLIDGAVDVSGPDGYRLTTRDVRVDLDKRTMQSSGPVNGTMELGTFSAGRLSADLEARTVTLDRGVRLKIRQGAVR